MPNPSTYYLKTNPALGSDCEARKALYNDAVRASGITESNWDRVVVHHPGTNISGGKSYSDIGGKRIWINGTLSTRFACHEIGHTYGCRHAQLWTVPAGSNPTTPPPNGSPEGSGYGDWFDVMGGNMWPTSANADAMDFSEQYKYQLGWIGDNRLQTLISGTYYNLKIYRCDDPYTLTSSTKSGVFAVKFSKDATYDYWLGYRTNFTNATAGVYVKWALKTFPATYLIDWVPSTNDPQTGGYLDAPVPPGSTL